MTDLALDKDAGGEIRLYDIDIEAASHNMIIGNRLPGNWRYSVCKTLPEAISGADFIIISILPGTFAEMRCDVHLPERLGVYQSVGDTTGPGGIIRAMRTVPIFVKLAEAIRNYAPDAWVINYTNPLALCLRTLYHIFPGIKALGFCHEVFGTQHFFISAFICPGQFEFIQYGLVRLFGQKGCQHDGYTGQHKRRQQLINAQHTAHWF